MEKLPGFKINHVIRFNINEMAWTLYVILLFYTPGPIALRTIIYRVSAEPYFGSNGWLGYTYNALAILAFIIGFIYLFKKNTNRIYIGYLVGYLAIINLIRPIVGATNIFQYNDFSLFLSLITGFGGYIIIKCYAHLNTEDAFDLLVIFNFATQCINILAGKQLDYGGRFAAFGSTTGSVGIICSTYMLYFLFCRKSDKHPLISITCCILSLFLSGSRYNMMMAIIFMFLFAFKLRKGLNLNNSKKHAVTILILAGIFFIPLIIQTLGSSIFGGLLNRAEDVIGAVIGRNSSYVTGDLSFNARMISLQAGLKAILDNPLGISISSIDLQAQTIKHGFTFFPHSTLLSYYLLWGPPALIIFVKMIVMIGKGIKYDNNSWILLLYLVVSFVVYGGPIIESKTYLWYILLLDFCKSELIDLQTQDLNEYQNEKIMEQV